MSRPAAAARPPFESLVEAHGTTVLRVCRALVGVQDADDVWQETFLAALRAYPCADVRNTEAWLVTIARNKAADHHRKAGRLPIPASSTGPRSGGVLAGNGNGYLAGHRLGVVGAEGGDGVVRAVEAGEDAAVVWAAIGKLPTKQREAVVFHHLAGLRHAEVAALLGNSEEAARRAASDGMKTLRKLLSTSAAFEGRTP